MRLFGFDIIRCTKQDYQELETYKLTTTELYNRLVEFGDFTAGIIGNRREDVSEDALLQMIFERTETCCKLILLYEQSKFSIPITAIAVSTRMNQLRQHASHLQHFILRHVSLQSRMEQFEEDHDEHEYDEEYSEVKEDYRGVDNRYYRARDHMAKVLYSDITAMLSVVQYDFFQIIFGVDILRDRKQRKKMPSGKPNYEVKIFNTIKSNKSNDGGNES